MKNVYLAAPDFDEKQKELFDLVKNGRKPLILIRGYKPIIFVKMKYFSFFLYPYMI